jgi:hypothetical protein
VLLLFDTVPVTILLEICGVVSDIGYLALLVRIIGKISSIGPLNLPIIRQNHYLVYRYRPMYGTITITRLESVIY